MSTPGELIPEPREYVLRNGAPDTIAGWKALVDGLLTDQACAFHRNLEISSRYAWIYKLLPDCFKWAGMAAFASHHVRYMVDDVERAVAFYTEHFGFAVRSEHAPAFADVVRGNLRLLLSGPASSAAHRRREAGTGSTSSSTTSGSRSSGCVPPA